MKRRKNGTALILLFAALLLMVGLSSCAPDPPTDADALRGQWAVYYDPDTPEKEEEFGDAIIDIQYTVPGYWCLGFVTSDSSSTDPDSEPLDPYEIDEATAAYFIKSNRTQSKEDGSFTVSSSALGASVEYKFIDADRNIMEAKITDINESDNTESGGSSQSEGSENSEPDVVIMKRLIDHEIKINADVLVVPGI